MGADGAHAGHKAMLGAKSSRTPASRRDKCRPPNCVLSPRGTVILGKLGLASRKKRGIFAKSGFAPVQGYVSLMEMAKIVTLEEINEH